MRIERVPLSALPRHFRPIPVAFAAADPRIRPRFPIDVRDTRALVAHAKKAAARGLEPEVADRLEPGPALDKLKAGAAAVVAGQQPSVALGPFYNFLKASTAVAWARRLEAEGVPAVAVFWNHSDDDHGEGLNRITLPDRQEVLRTLEAPWSSEGILAHREARLDLDALAQLLPDAPGRPEVVSLLRRCMTGPVAADFSRLLHALFGPELLVVEPAQLDGARARAVFAKALSEPGLVQRLVDEGGKKLESAGFDAAINRSHGSNVYAIEGARRVRVEKMPGDARRLSAGVALRLVLQDSVLPAALTVAGPNEIAYLAQLLELYRFFGLPGPAVAPRVGATIVEPRVARAAEAMALKGADLLSGEEALRTKMAERSRGGLIAEVESLSLEWQRKLEGLEGSLGAVDPKLAELARKTRGKVGEVLAAFRERIVASGRDADAVASERIRRIAAHLAPEGKLQERVLPVWYFASLRGLEVLKDLRESLDPFSPDHQIVWM
jgi:uncharacterized protein YllA (UPF0747 family)